MRRGSFAVRIRCAQVSIAGPQPDCCEMLRFRRIARANVIDSFDFSGARSADARLRVLVKPSNLRPTEFTDSSPEMALAIDKLSSRNLFDELPQMTSWNWQICRSKISVQNKFLVYTTLERQTHPRQIPAEGPKFSVGRDHQWLVLSTPDPRHSRSDSTRRKSAVEFDFNWPRVASSEQPAAFSSRGHI